MEAIDKIQIGDIYVCTYGYDQTNVNFYEVVDKTKKMVRVRPIFHHTTEEGFMCGHATPMPGRFKERYDSFVDPKEGKLCKVHSDGWIGLTRGHLACPWDGEPCYESWYA